MANFHVQGIDGLAKGLELLGQKTGPMAEDMLHAGALILIGTWNRVIIARGHVETGAMLRSVKATKPKINKDGNLEIQVYPQGAERKEHRKTPKRRLCCTTAGKAKKATTLWTKSKNQGLQRQ